jgi:hypothetical protein
VIINIRSVGGLLLQLFLVERALNIDIMPMQI